MFLVAFVTFVTFMTFVAFMAFVAFVAFVTFVPFMTLSWRIMTSYMTFMPSVTPMMFMPMFY